jgi:uncharacterized SAM-binding protein YcdF (DUF218 family)
VVDGIGFVLKKVISRLCFPLGLSLVLGLVGLTLWRRRQGRGPRLDDGLGRGAGLGWWLAAAGWALLLVFSLPLTSWLLLAPIERQAGDYADAAALTAQGVKTIVVLGGGVHQGERTVYDRLKSGTAQRVMEAVRLWRQMPEGRILLSGGSYDPGLAEAQVMAALARDLGVPETALELETESWDTGEQAVMLRQRLNGEPFALVTSAFHMRRSLALFRAQGLRPCPAPTDFGTKGASFTYNTLLPQAGGLSASEAAIYEYMGWAWYQLKSWLGLGAGRELPLQRPDAVR